MSTSSAKSVQKSHQLAGTFFWQINFIKSPSSFHYTEIFFTCEVDMREVSCRPVKSDDEILTGAPRCNLILTFLSRSIPDTGRGEVLAVRKIWISLVMGNGIIIWSLERLHFQCLHLELPQS